MFWNAKCIVHYVDHHSFLDLSLVFLYWCNFHAPQGAVIYPLFILKTLIVNIHLNWMYMVAEVYILE